MAERRRSLTPLDSELTAGYEPAAPARPSLRDRLRRRRRTRRPPTTLRRVVAQGLIRLGIAVGVASAVAIGLDQLMNRDTAVGFYIVGGAVLAVAFMTSASDITTPYYYTQGEREFRVRMSFAYVLAGALVVGIGVAIEAL